MNEAEYLMKNYRDRGPWTTALKTWLKHAYLHQSIDVKFIFDSARLGLFSSTNIFQAK